MSEPSGHTRELRKLTPVEEARAAGVSWEQLIAEFTPPPADPAQHRSARSYVQFRSGREPAADPETVARAARILRASPDASLTEKALGLLPGEVDFGDVAEVLDREASRIHRPGELTQSSGGGRHEAPDLVNSFDAFASSADHGGQTDYSGDEQHW